MDSFSIGWMVGALVVLLVISAFFSIAETSMMAVNRYRLKHMAAQGHSGARRVEELLKRTDRLLGAILIGNNVVNALIATVCGVISYQLFGQGRVGWAVTASTLAASFLIIVFSISFRPPLFNTPQVLERANVDPPVRNGRRAVGSLAQGVGRELLPARLVGCERDRRSLLRGGVNPPGRGHDRPPETPARHAVRPRAAGSKDRHAAS